MFSQEIPQWDVHLKQLRGQFPYWGVQGRVMLGLGLAI